jgi:hypothetical protein
MPNPLRQALGYLWMTLSSWRRRGRVAVKREEAKEGSGGAAARARFWIEFREGQREADAHSRQR